MYADQTQLDYIISNSLADVEIPITVTYGSLTALGTLELRGATSLHLRKKNFHLRVPDWEELPPGEHHLLNACYRDASMMRNTLGQMLTRDLGLPAPMTEFVTLEINGSMMGVYERVERIDRLFYERIGRDFGPLFKSVDITGRLACFYADTSGTTGYEPKVDGAPYRQDLLSLIEASFRGESNLLAAEEFMGMFAVNTALADGDGIIKNYYLHFWNGLWHVYPWDRDATFGNDWTGEYIPDWYQQPWFHDIGYSGAAAGLFQSMDNVVLFNEYLHQCGDLFSSVYSTRIDSLRLELRGPLAQDPYYRYTPEQFDSICCRLSDDIQARAQVLHGITVPEPPSRVVDFSVENSLDLSEDDELEVEVTVASPEPLQVVLVTSINGEQSDWLYMEPEEQNKWELEMELPEDVYSVRFAIGTRFKDPQYLTFFYPSWSSRGFHTKPLPLPGARVALAPLEPSLLEPGTPVDYGPDLWILPLSNNASHTQDLSLCVFTAGEPAGTVFLPESVLVESGETVYLTNNLELGRRYTTGRVFGDAGTNFPENTGLSLLDPAWNTLHTWSIPTGTSYSWNTSTVIPSEICFGAGNDWVELYNRGSCSKWISGWHLEDSSHNVHYFPEGTILEPGEFLVCSAESITGIPSENTHMLGFNLNADQDSLILYNDRGQREFAMGWNTSWPGHRTGIMYLQSPLSPVSSPFSWRGEELPGSPGALNQGWRENCELSLELTSSNPVTDGTVSFSYASNVLPLAGAIYDLSGRRLCTVPVPEPSAGSVDVDVSTLPSGVYFIQLRSSGNANAKSFIILKGMN